MSSNASNNDEYYNDHQSQQSLNCSVQNSSAQSSTNNGVINITSSPSISHQSNQSNPDNNSINTRSTTTNSSHLQLPSTAQRLMQFTQSTTDVHNVQHPIPFNITNNYHILQSLPPQLSLPSFNSSSASSSSSAVVVSAAIQLNNLNNNIQVMIVIINWIYHIMHTTNYIVIIVSDTAMYNINNSNTATTNLTPRSNAGGYNSYDYGVPLPGSYTMYSNK